MYTDPFSTPFFDCLICIAGIFFYVLHRPKLLRNFPLFLLNTERKVYAEIGRTVPSPSTPLISGSWSPRPCFFAAGKAHKNALSFLMLYRK